MSNARVQHAVDEEK